MTVYAAIPIWVNVTDDLRQLKIENFSVGVGCTDRHITNLRWNQRPETAVGAIYSYPPPQ